MLQSNKHDENGNVALFKARHVIDGRGQTNYQYDIDTYAPNMQKESLRCLCCMAVQEDLGMEANDVVQAFLLPTLMNGEVYYAYPPPGFCLCVRQEAYLSRKAKFYCSSQPSTV